ncbi:MAG TPA: RNA-binding cell elongation regulator Jag/EloR [Acidimicrobiales bacterium]
MEWVETTGRSVDEAKEAALDRLGVGEDDAEFELLAEPKSGLFGRIRTEARVRARVRPTRPRPKDDRRERRRKSRPRTTSKPKDSAEPAAAVSPPPQGRRPARNGAKAMEDEASVAEQGEMARLFVSDLLDRFGASGTVEVVELDEETVEVSVQGQDLGLLIGHKGATLASLQELTRTVVQRHTGGQTARVLVDVAGYRQKRRAALERFARQVADEVRESGNEQQLEPMTPPDRKVIHDAVNAIDGVATRSEGLEPQRRVVVAPDGD